MNLSVNKSIKVPAFKGYDAVPVKSLYMQNLSGNFAVDFFEELKQIGQKEDFDVFIQDSEKIQNNSQNLKNDKFINRPWAQDNKILRKNEGKIYTLFSTLIPQEYEKQVKQFADFTNSILKKTDTLLEGGNIFIGKKDNGEDWLLLGKDSVSETSINDFLADCDVENIDCDRFNEFLNSGIINRKQDGTGNIISIDDWIMNKKQYDLKAINKISKDFGVKEKNIYTIPQGNFHNDMFIRPVGYPYVLVNDNASVLENISELPYGAAKLRQKTKDNETLRLEQYASTEKIVKSLKKYGFTPIKIAGIYGKGEVNYLNAIVHKHNDGTLTYITNSAACKKDGYSQLDNLFEKQLREKLPNIKNVYFIKGDYENIAGNAMMYSLHYLNGGIHCYTCEEPDFDKI